MAKRISRIGKPEDATPRWVDKTFALSDRVMCRLRGNVNTPDEAYMLLTLDGDEGAENTRLSSLTALKVLCSEMQDFIARMLSRGDH